MMRSASISVALSLVLLAASTGPAGAASLTPSGANFGPQPVGTVSAARTFVLNTDADPAFTVAIAVTGDFRQTNNCPPVLVMGVAASCTISVRFAPEKEGLRSGSLIGNSLLGAPVSALRGTGSETRGGLGRGACKKGKTKKRAAAAKKKKRKKGKGCKKKRGKKKGKRKK